jgi:hypothetical protein
MDCPYLVRALDADEVDGVPFLVTEFCDGSDLARLVSRRGPLSVADACELVRQAALGLQHAHEHGLVHRDVKPSNLMLTRAGQAKVLDLGLALLRRDRTAEDRMTATGGVLGTFDYMAPEQASDAHAVDVRADVYSLGCTLYHLLTGAAPFAGVRPVLEKVRAHAEAEVPPVRGLRPEVPEALVAVLARMLAKEPDRRFATPAEVAAALEPFTAGCDLTKLAAEETGGTKAPRPPTVPAAPRPRRRRALAAGLALAAALALAVGGVALYRAWAGLGSPPALEALRFTVRRDGDNGRVFFRDLVSGGAGLEPGPIEPALHVPQDDFRLVGRFRQPTCWYLVWIDTSGRAKVEGHSEGKRAEVRYPASADRMAPVDSSDPAGVHLLVLIAGAVPPPEGEHQLAARLAGVGPPPQVMPRRWCAQFRGAGVERPAPPDLESSGYLQDIEERIPAGLRPVYYVFLPTEK